MSRFGDLWNSQPLIGVVHVPALPGAPRYCGDWRQVRAQALADVAAYVEGGADGILLENFHDAPFYPQRVPAETVAHLAALGALVRESTSLPLGVNVLRNDGLSALSIAHASGAQFIRVNVLAGARVADQGLLSAIAHDLLRLRRQLAADSILILADVDVKHSAPLAARPLEEEVAELRDRSGADGLIVTGPATGEPASEDDLRRVASAAGDCPVLVGSGITPENITALRGGCQGFIVGSWCKRSGVLAQPVDVERVAQLSRALRGR